MVRHGVTSGVSGETSSNRHVTPHLRREYERSVVCVSSCARRPCRSLTLFVYMFLNFLFYCPVFFRAILRVYMLSVCLRIIVYFVYVFIVIESCMYLLLFTYVFMYLLCLFTLFIYVFIIVYFVYVIGMFAYLLFTLFMYLMLFMFMPAASE